MILKVGIDNTHYSEIDFADGHDGKIFIVGSSESNGFHLKEFNDLSKSDFQLVYVMH